MISEGKKFIKVEEVRAYQWIGTTFEPLCPMFPLSFYYQEKPKPIVCLPVNDQYEMKTGEWLVIRGDGAVEVYTDNAMKRTFKEV